MDAWILTTLFYPYHLVPTLQFIASFSLISYLLLLCTQIREILQLPEMTPEEEAQAREEHKWIFEDGNN
jgi:hypothetical protein